MLRRPLSRQKNMNGCDGQSMAATWVQEANIVTQINIGVSCRPQRPIQRSLRLIYRTDGDAPVRETAIIAELEFSAKSRIFDLTGARKGG